MPLTTVGNCSEENRWSTVYEQLAQKRPKVDRAKRYQYHPEIELD